MGLTAKVADVDQGAITFTARDLVVTVNEDATGFSEVLRVEFVVAPVTEEDGTVSERRARDSLGVVHGLDAPAPPGSAVHTRQDRPAGHSPERQGP